MVLNRHLSILTALSTMIQRKMRIPLPFKFVILVLTMLWAAPVLAKSVEIETKHRGIRLVGVSLPLTERQDVEIMALAPAMAKIKKAIEEAILDGDIANEYDAAYEFMLKIKLT